MKQLAARGAYPLVRLTFGGALTYHRAWLEHAPLEVVSEPASIEAHALENCDALLSIAAPDTTRGGAAAAVTWTRGSALAAVGGLGQLAAALVFVVNMWTRVRMPSAAPQRQEQR